jgi:hypothetical protein
LFLVFFELFYLFLVHYPMSVKQVRSGGKSECDVYSQTHPALSYSVQAAMDTLVPLQKVTAI